MSITTSEKLIKVSAVTKNTSIQQKYYYTKIVITLCYSTAKRVMTLCHHDLFSLTSHAYTITTRKKYTLDVRGEKN